MVIRPSVVGAGEIFDIPHKNPTLLTTENDTDIGPAHPDLAALSAIESMLVARVRPLVQDWAVRAGQLVYVGHIVNLEQKVDEWPRPHPA